MSHEGSGQQGTAQDDHPPHPPHPLSQGREGAGQQAVEGDLSPLQAAKRDFTELQQLVQAARAAAPTAQEKLALTQQYKPLLDAAYERMREQQQQEQQVAGAATTSGAVVGGQGTLGASGSGTLGSGPNGVYASARWLLRQALPTIRCKCEGDSSNLKDYPESQRLEVVPWTSFPQDVQGLLSVHEPRLQAKQIVRAAYPSAEDIQEALNEESSNAMFMNAAVQAVMDCVEIPAHLHGQGPLWKQYNIRVPGQPDKPDGLVYLANRGHAHPLLVFEGKAMPVIYIDDFDETELARLSQPKPYNMSKWQRQHRLLLQPLLYMRHTGARFAILSSYTVTFFIERTGEHKFKVSPGVYPYACVQPISVKEGLFYLLQRSLDENNPFVPCSEASLLVAEEEHGGGGGGRGSGRTRGAGTKRDQSKLGQMSLHTPLSSGAKRVQHDGRQASTAPSHMLSAVRELRATQHCVVLLGMLDGCDEVAVKAVDAWQEKEMVLTLKHEAAIYGRLKHLQGVCIPAMRIAGFWRGNSSYVLVTQYISNSRTLEDHLSLCGSLQPGLAHAAEEALSKIHDAGVLHGDLDGSNILIKTEPYTVLFIDFAASRMSPPPTTEEKQHEMQELHSMLHHTLPCRGEEQ